MADSRASGPVVVLPCNGLSARGLVTTMAADQITAEMGEVMCLNIVPLLAGVPDEVASLRGARAVVGVAGCGHRCDARACQKAMGRDPDQSLVVGELLRAEVIEKSECTDEELHQCALEVSSRLVGVLGKL